MKMASSPPPAVASVERNLLKGNPEAGGTLMRASLLDRQAANQTSSLFPVTPTDVCSQERQAAGGRCVHLAWSLAADGNGILRPRAHWLVE